jgi:hypothetical protein
VVDTAALIVSNGRGSRAAGATEYRITSELPSAADGCSGVLAARDGNKKPPRDENQNDRAPCNSSRRHITGSRTERQNQPVAAQA